jgi:hypothetical protein
MVLGVLILLAVDIGAIAASATHVATLRSGSQLSRNVRLFVFARIAELLLFALILTLSVLTRSPWLLLGMVVPLVFLPLTRRTLKRRELAASLAAQAPLR